MSPHPTAPTQCSRWSRRPPDPATTSSSSCPAGTRGASGTGTAPRRACSCLPDCRTRRPRGPPQRSKRGTRSKDRRRALAGRSRCRHVTALTATETPESSGPRRYCRPAVKPCAVASLIYYLRVRSRPWRPTVGRPARRCVERIRYPRGRRDFLMSCARLARLSLSRVLVLHLRCVLPHERRVPVVVLDGEVVGLARQQPPSRSTTPRFVKAMSFLSSSPEGQPGDKATAFK